MKKKSIRVIASLLGIITLFALSGCDVDNGKTISENEKLSSFDKINLDLDTVSVHLEQGDDFSISYEGSEKLKPKYSVDNGILNVKSRKSNSISISINGSGDDSLTITVPKDTKLNDVDLSVDTGEIEVNDCNIDIMKADTDTGTVDIKNTSVNDLSSDIDTGDFTASILGNIDSYNYKLSTDTGDIALNDTECKESVSKDNGSDKNINVSSDTGDIDLSFTK